VGTKTLLVALDSIEPRLMQLWTNAGHLPNLGRILNRASLRPILNFRGYGNGVYWPSFNTAARPEQHGRFYVDQLVPRSYRVAPFDSANDFHAEPFWVEVDRQGGRVTVVDAVRTPTTDLKNGFEIQNWLAHDSDGPIRTRPAALASTLLARFGEDPMAMGSDRYLRADGDLASFIELCRVRANHKTAWCAEQLRSTDWDLYYIAFSEAHDIGHHYWHLHDPTHPKHDPALRASIGDPLLRIYQHLDNSVGELMAAAGPNAAIIIVTGPGMETNISGNHLLETILGRLQRPEGAITSSVRATSPSRVRATLRAAVPAIAQRGVAHARSYFFGSDDERARATSRYFALPHNDNAGAVRINLKGREPRGKVKPGVECTTTLDDLEASLREIRDTEKGSPVVSDIVRVACSDRPTQVSALPDLLVIWNREANMNSVASPRIGRLDMSISRQRTGDHSDRGEIIVMSDNPLPETPNRWAAADPAEIGAFVRTICMQNMHRAK
jgi:predicted AlkP superfamily phosphohydrolase/phosphomutase